MVSKKQTNPVNVKKISTIKMAVTFIAILGTSMLGVSIFDISLNKIAIIPLYLYLILTCKGKKIYMNKVSLIYFLFIFVQTISCIRAVLIPRITYPDYYSRLFRQIIQNIYIYIPMIFLINSLNENDKESWIVIIKKCISKASMIHCTWIFIELAFYYLLHLDINKIVFEETLKSAIKGISYYIDYSKGSGVVRMAGLGFDPAYAGYILALGVAVEEKWTRKWLYLITTLLIFSRSAVLTSSLIIALSLLKKLNKDFLKKFIKFFFSTIILIGIIIICLNFNSVFKEHVELFFYRMNLKQKNMSNNMHLGFIYYLPDMYFNELSITEKIFGLGTRVEGLATIRNIHYKYILNSRTSLLHAARPIECDIAGVLLSSGIFGYVFYYITLLKSGLRLSENNRYIMIVIFVFGFMYNVATSSITYIILIFVSAYSIKQSTKGEKTNQYAQASYNLYRCL